MPGPIAHNKCARKFAHKWETWKKTPSHIIQICVYCKGKNWKPRND